MAEAPACDPDTPPFAADDPPAWKIVNPIARRPLLLVCDHASNFIPERLGRLGVSTADAQGHIAWDIGAAAVTRRMSECLGAPAVLSGYSRLLIDCNRDPEDPSAIPEISGDVPIPGNRRLDAVGRAQRRDALFAPYHRAIGTACAGLRGHGVPPVLVSIHSFTPCLCGTARPWHVGVLWNRDPRLAVPALDRLRGLGSLCVGDNQPYSAREIGYTMDTHAGTLGLPHVTFEIRQDLVGDDDGCDRWAALLGGMVADLLADASVHRVEAY